MTADWTTARVVRDDDGRLWGRDSWTADAYLRRWVQVGTEREVGGCYEGDMARRYGPLTPVLDADGLPVVRTVGDLNARHIGKRVRFRYSSPEGAGPEDEGVLYGMEFVRGRLSDLWVNVWLDDYGCDPFDLTIDTPCEVLP